MGYGIERVSVNPLNIPLSRAINYTIDGDTKSTISMKTKTDIIDSSMYIHIKYILKKVNFLFHSFTNVPLRRPLLSDNEIKYSPGVNFSVSK